MHVLKLPFFIVCSFLCISLTCSGVYGPTKRELSSTAVLTSAFVPLQTERSPRQHERTMQQRLNRHRRNFIVGVAFGAILGAVVTGTIMNGVHSDVILPTNSTTNALTPSLTNFAKPPIPKDQLQTIFHPTPRCNIWDKKAFAQFKKRQFLHQPKNNRKHR